VTADHGTTTRGRRRVSWLRRRSRRILGRHTVLPPAACCWNQRLKHLPES